MSETSYTYRIRRIITAALIWEVIFAVLLFGALSLLGYNSTKSSHAFAFREPDRLWLFILLIPISVIYFYNLYTSNQPAKMLDDRLRKLVFQSVSGARSFMKYFFFRNAFAFLILALAQPLFGNKKISGTIESMELVICLDVSSSMNVKDISNDLTRLDIAKRALIQLMNNLHGEKIGICVFAGGAYVQLPLTSDYGAAKLFVSDIETDILSNQGTNIAAAIETANGMFSEQRTSKAIILVTDGENHEEDPTSELTKLQEKNIGLSILGLGTRTGGPVPHNPDRPELGYKTNALGAKVISKVDPGFIRSIASKGGGSAVISSDEFPDMRELLTEINQMKRTKIRDLQFETKENRYQIPLAAAMICWILYLLVPFIDLSRKTVK